MADNLPLNRQDMKDPATAHLRIYVGGLIDKPNLDELYDHFAPYGKLNGIIVNRNFGFVQYETEAQAHEAIKQCDGSTFKGRMLSVRAAQTHNFIPKLQRRSDAEVGNIQSDVPPSVALHDNQQFGEENDDMYDSYGNFVGDQSYRNEEYEDGSARGEGVHGRGRGAVRGVRGRGRGRGGPAGPGYRDRSPVGGRGEWGAERGGYDRYSQQIPDYPRTLPVTERNDCEIIVVSKALTEFAEYIEGRLKRLGIVVDLLFPMEDVPIGKVLGNIASRGCLYAILVMPQNQEHRSLTLTILHGLPQEHRNMPLEDALQLLSRNFQEVQRGGPSGREAVYALLGQLADGRSLTVLQYDKVIEYLQERREQQVKLELGEPLTPAMTATTKKTEVDLQQRILSILNDKKVATNETPPAPVSVPTPAPTQNKLLNDPTVRKALDSILQKLT